MSSNTARNSGPSDDQLTDDRSPAHCHLYGIHTHQQSLSEVERCQQSKRIRIIHLLESEQENTCTSTSHKSDNHLPSQPDQQGLQQ